MTVPLLSPEMMARAIVSEPDWWQPAPEFLIDFDRLREHIAHTIAFDRGYARAAEREACALLVEEYGYMHTADAIRRRSVARSTQKDIQKTPDNPSGQK